MWKQRIPQILGRTVLISENHYTVDYCIYISFSPELSTNMSTKIDFLVLKVAKSPKSLKLFAYSLSIFDCVV